MKTLLRLGIIVCVATILACNTKEKTTETDAAFKKDLHDLSERNYNLFYLTRSGELELNEDAMDLMITDAANLSTTYDLENKIAKTNYYTNLEKDTENNGDVYDWFELINNNSTDMFQAMIYEMVIEEKQIPINNIINNNSLLPNEQIALTILTNIIKNDIALETKAVNSCRGQYNAHMKECKKWLYIGSGLTLASAVFSFGTLSALFAFATTVDYSNCSDSATEEFLNCLSI